MTTWTGFMIDNDKQTERAVTNRAWYATIEAERWYDARDQIAVTLACSPLDLRVHEDKRHYLSKSLEDAKP